MSQQTTDFLKAPATISEAEFVKLCDDLYVDRQQIYRFNPNTSRREALLWMLLGCLISLLSISDTEQPSLNSSSADPYGQAVREILLGRTQPPFDPQAHLAELSAKLKSEDESEAV
jgi:hypothetical protein